MSNIWGNIYKRSIATVFGTVYFSTFLRLWKLIFWRKIFQCFFCVFFLSKKQQTVSTKTSITQEWLVVESCPTPCWVTSLIFCRLVYNISSHLVCILNFIISKTGSKCNWLLRPADSNWVIIMELKRNVEYNWPCTFWAS